jgi:uncharacterized protein (DUF433 family)
MFPPNALFTFPKFLGSPPESLLPSGSRKGKLTSMAATSYRYLVNLPGVCQGKTIVEGTRIGVHYVVGLILNGASVDDVCRSFPDLSRAQVYECLAYYEDHRTQIDALVADRGKSHICCGTGNIMSRSYTRCCRSPHPIKKFLATLDCKD